jgi:hypothetical protein
MKPIFINTTQKGLDKFLIGCWVLIYLKIRETNREMVLKREIYENVKKGTYL